MRREEPRLARTYSAGLLLSQRQRRVVAGSGLPALAHYGILDLAHIAAQGIEFVEHRFLEGLTAAGATGGSQ